MREKKERKERKERKKKKRKRKKKKRRGPASCCGRIRKGLEQNCAMRCRCLPTSVLFYA